MGRGDYTADVRRGSPRAAVGNILYHTVGEREDMIEQLSAGFAALQNEIMRAAGYSADPYKAASGPLWDWWRNAGIPTINEWQKFQGDKGGSWMARFGSDWSVYTDWYNRLMALREIATAHGLHLQSAPPPSPPETIWDKGKDVVDAIASKAGDVGSDAWKMAKIAIYGGLAIGGLLLVSSIATNVRNKQDPMAPFMAMRGRVPNVGAFTR